MKKGILVVSFGTSFEDARVACIDSVYGKIAERFDSYEVRQAFTSRRIIKKLKERDSLHIDTEQEALDKMIQEGFDEILIQPLHIMPGYEYEKMQRAVSRAKHHYTGRLELGEPLLYKESDYAAVVDALDKELSKLAAEEHIESWLLMGHGTHHPANATYSCLQLHFEMMDKPMRVAALESFPNLEHSMPLMDKSIKWGVIPFMLVAGDHAKNDMAGDEEDSWVNVLAQASFNVVPYLCGLGSMTSFMDLFADKIEEMVRRGDTNAI